MKKLFAIALIAATIFICGCGNQTAEQPAPNNPKVEQPAPEPERVDAVLVAGSFLTFDAENMPLLADALNRNDIEYLKQLVVEEKIFRVDKDTKILQIDEATSDGSIAIHFKEGRYTNKDGYAFAYTVFTEKEYPVAYLETQEQPPLQLIQSALAHTDNFFESIKSEDVEALNQLLTFCEVTGKKLRETANNSQLDFATRECMTRAREILLHRGAAISGDLDVIKYRHKSEQENLSADEISQYKKEHKLAVEVTYQLSKDALRLRQDFKTSYGF